ncbi:MAG: hypothetical protein LC774_08920 [Acidobacteria bacterium]|nr:hypothetical protein [Acidobacteriota bacterium]
MKLKIFVAVLAVAIAWFAGRQFYRVAGQNEVAGGDAQTVAEQIKAGEQTVNASQTLDAGARVEVSGINGPVDIMTTEGNVAEIHIENSVSDARDLDAHKITIDRAADRLVVRGENKNGGGLGLLRWLIGRGGSSTTVRQRVVLKVPRRVEVVARGINGALRVGELEGAVRVSGINGDGNIELRLDREVNADVRVGGLNGSVDYDLKNVTVEDGGENHSRFVARIGAGGAPIRMSGISGNIRLAGA